MWSKDLIINKDIILLALLVKFQPEPLVTSLIAPNKTLYLLESYTNNELYFLN